MNSRERVLKALNHEKPDRVPYDFGSTQLTGISVVTYRNLREHLGLPKEEIELSDSLPFMWKCARHHTRFYRNGGRCIKSRPY